MWSHRHHRIQSVEQRLPHTREIKGGLGIPEHMHKIVALAHALMQTHIHSVKPYLVKLGRQMPAKPFTSAYTFNILSLCPYLMYAVHRLVHTLHSVPTSCTVHRLLHTSHSVPTSCTVYRLLHTPHSVPASCTVHRLVHTPHPVLASCTVSNTSSDSTSDDKYTKCCPLQSTRRLLSILYRKYHQGTV